MQVGPIGPSTFRISSEVHGSMVCFDNATVIPKLRISCERLLKQVMRDDSHIFSKCGPITVTTHCRC